MVFGWRCSGVVLRGWSCNVEKWWEKGGMGGKLGDLRLKEGQRNDAGQRKESCG